MAKAKSGRGPGRPRLSDKGKGASHILGVRYGGELLARLDKWRKAQGSKPARSEAARRLTETALTAAGY
jgi:hypothetical protein